jgi:prepilin peptidase CpaA
MLSIEFNQLLLFALILVCVATDLKNRRIYNYILLPALILALFIAYFNNGWLGIINSFKGLVLGLLLLLVPYLKGGLGGGDVKLLGVIGSIMGPGFVFTTFVFGALLGGFISLFILVHNGRLLSTFVKYFPSFNLIIARHPFILPDSSGNSETLSLPYSIPLALGAMYSLYSYSLTGGIL